MTAKQCTTYGVLYVCCQLAIPSLSESSRAMQSSTHTHTDSLMCAYLIDPICAPQLVLLVPTDHPVIQWTRVSAALPIPRRMRQQLSVSVWLATSGTPLVWHCSAPVNRAGKAPTSVVQVRYRLSVWISVRTSALRRSYCHNLVDACVLHVYVQHTCTCVFSLHFIRNGHMPLGCMRVCMYLGFPTHVATCFNMHMHTPLKQCVSCAYNLKIHVYVNQVLLVS